MGIPGILKEIGKGERVALAKLAIDHLERTRRPLRIAIDAAIWNFQNQAGQGGKNPALRTLFFRLLKLLALPIHPVFVYDGKNKPLTKRGKTVTRYGTCVENETAKQLLSAFRFPYHTAPGEAEAECAFLQKKGIVDAVMSQDADAIMFGSTLTLRDWSKEGTRGNKTPTHVNVMDLTGIKRLSGLDPEGMILVALLSGGDYDENGVPGFGCTLSCEIARAGFASDLLELIRNNDTDGLTDWRERLDYELQTNESGYFKRRHLKLSLPESFPNRTILGYYTSPIVSKESELESLQAKWLQQWASQIDIPALRHYTASNFDWNWKSGARRYIRCTAQPLLHARMIRQPIKNPVFHIDDITEERRHFTNDGIVELRLRAIPADIVGIDMEAEEDDPEEAGIDEDTEVEEASETINRGEAQSSCPESPSKRKKTLWNPYMPEKWWIPQTLLQLGLPTVVESWQQLQRDIAADPKKFATRKCPKTAAVKATKALDAQMKAGSLHAFLVQRSEDVPASSTQRNTIRKEVPRTPTKPRTRLQSEETSPSIIRFFKPQKSTIGSQPQEAPRHKASTPGDRDMANKHIEVVATEPQRPTTIKTAQIIQGPEPGSMCLKSLTPDITAVKTPLEEVVPMTASKSLTGDGSLNFVTQRKPRHDKPARTTPSSSRQAQNFQHEYSEIASFVGAPPEYQPSNRSSGPKTRIGYHELAGTVQVRIQPKASSRVRKLAASRDSLPGAWKEVDLETGSGQRIPRVSFIDLSGD